MANPMSFTPATDRRPPTATGGSTRGDRRALSTFCRCIAARALVAQLGDTADFY